MFLINNFKLAAKSIADIYKARWQVELFFKWIKQNLKIKSFIGTSKNAVMTQIWITCVFIYFWHLSISSQSRRKPCGKYCVYYSLICLKNGT
ncbi:transposase [Candidatus Vondammii sp. HM_W22]|uniref:transposase n=1 Tax=Candidatus Vondammii sp. HM_W22 TaxID=2687299 RepID=UPI00403E1521